jgi:hypothetical protein
VIRIDLRYVVPVVVFYMPAFMFLTLGWMVGYSTAEMREAVVVVGGTLGLIASATTIAYYSAEVSGPQWFYIRGGEKDD